MAILPLTTVSDLPLPLMPGKKALRLQDLADFEMQTTAVKNTAPLTPEDVLARMALDTKKMQQAKDDIETGKSILAAMRADGLVGDVLVHPSITLTWQTKKTYSYSPAIRAAQQVERSTGEAIERTSGGWVARLCPNKSQGAD